MATFVNNSVDAQIASIVNTLVNSDSDTSGIALRKLTLALKSAFVNKKINDDSHLFSFSKYPALYFESRGYEDTYWKTDIIGKLVDVSSTDTIGGVNYVKSGRTWIHLASQWADDEVAVPLNLQGEADWPNAQTEGRWHWTLLNLHPTDARVKRYNHLTFGGTLATLYPSLVPPVGFVVIPIRNNTTTDRDVTFEVFSNNYTPYGGSSDPNRYRQASFCGHVLTPAKTNSFIGELEDRQFTVDQLYSETSYLSTYQGNQKRTVTITVPADKTVIFIGAHPGGFGVGAYEMTGSEILSRYKNIENVFDEKGYVTPDKRVLHNILSKQSIDTADFWRLKDVGSDQLML